MVKAVAKTMTAMKNATLARKQAVVSFVHRYQGTSGNMLKVKGIRAKEVVAPALVQSGAHTCACAKCIEAQREREREI